MLIIGSIVVCTLIVICAITTLVCRVYRNNILGKMEKPLSFTDGFVESTALRTGNYTVDHLKLTTIVGKIVPSNLNTYRYPADGKVIVFDMIEIFF